jgi:hypothetical protein
MQFEFIEDFNIECLGEQEIEVFDIEVENNHNFFANDILIHNSVYIQTEPLIPYILSKYKNNIKYYINKNMHDTPDNSIFKLNNLVKSCNSKDEIYKKYFRPNNFIINGLAEECIVCDINENDLDVIVETCMSNNINLINKRDDRLFLDYRELDDFKKMFLNTGVKFKRIYKSSVLDDFANTVIQRMIDDHYVKLADILNSKNKMVMKREVIAISFQ